MVDDQHYIFDIKQNTEGEVGYQKESNETSIVETVYLQRKKGWFTSMGAYTSIT